MKYNLSRQKYKNKLCIEFIEIFSIKIYALVFIKNI